MPEETRINATTSHRPREQAYTVVEDYELLTRFARSNDSRFKNMCKWIKSLLPEATEQTDSTICGRLKYG